MSGGIEPVPGLLFTSSVEGSQDVSQLVGKTFYSLSNGDNEVIAACQDGAYAISSTGDVSAMTTTVFRSVCAGKGFYIAVDVNNKLYSWGVCGSGGQLGKGACHQSLLAPSKIEHDAKFVSVSCGQAFAMALDNKSCAYSWGENFNRQLGLYTKTKAEMHLPNSVIEDLSFVPRLIPLSLSHPVLSIACGHSFALAITKGGVLYSWGAGECGQLGTGRVTQREIPAPVMLTDTNTTAATEPEDTPAPAIANPLIVRNVACGAAHVVAVDEHGHLYCWGMNKSNQLGLDNNFCTQHFPAAATVLLSEVSDDPSQQHAVSTVLKDVIIDKVFANGHSSAAIDTQGRLYTWGSTAHHRLMHRLPLQPPVLIEKKTLSYSELRTQRMACAKGNIGHFKAKKIQELQDAGLVKADLQLPITTISRPTLVQTVHLKDCAIESFSFSSTHSAALVLTCLKKAYPTVGPRRSFSKLQLLGNGFWSSSNIIVKFTFKQSNWSNPAELNNLQLPNSSRTNTSSRLPPASALIPSRSCAGVYIDSNTLQCKPPKFAETGIYSVSISMDGTTFLSDTVEIFVHQELTVQKQLPELFDFSTSTTLDDVELHVAGLPNLPVQWTGTYTVRLQFFCVEGVPGQQAHTSHSTGHGAISTKHIGGGGSLTKAASALGTEDFSITTEARILPPPSAATTRPSTPGSHHNLNENNPEETEGESPVPAVDTLEEASTVLLCNNIDLTEFKLKAGRALYEMRCQLSLNGQDFSSLKVSHALHKPRHSEAQGVESGQSDYHHGSKATPATLFYSVTPTSVQPSCVSIDRFTSAAADSLHSQIENEQSTEKDRSLELYVKGCSFLPASRLPKGAFVEARLVPTTSEIEWKNGYIPVWTDEEAALNSVPPIQCPVRCDGCVSLTIEINSQAEGLLGRMITAINSLANNLPPTDAEDGTIIDQNIETLSLKLEFDLHLPDRIIPLTHEDNTAMEPVFLKLYRNKPMQLIPGAVSSMSSEMQEFTMLVSRAVTEHDVAEGVSNATGKCADGFLFHSADAIIAIHVPVPPVAEGEEAPAGPAFYPPILLPQSDVRFLPVPIPMPEQPAVVSEEGEAGVKEEPVEVAEETVEDSMPVAATATDHHEIAVQKYMLQFSLPSATKLREMCHTNEQTIGEAQEPLSHVFVSCWLDGKSLPPPESWAKLQFYHTLTHQYAVNPPAPKIGFIPGNTITLDLAVYIPPPCVVHPKILQGCSVAEADVSIRAIVPLQCLLRIRGAPTEEFPEGIAVEVAGVITESTVISGTSAITFDIPEFTVEGMVPIQKTPKDKTLYYVDISIDGGISFDKAEEPLLFLK